MRIFILLGGAVLFLLGVKAWALPTYPVGHLESLTAGTGIAHLGSAAGLVYNPASLGGIYNSSLSASGSSYYMMKGTMNGSTAEASSFEEVPNSMLASWRVGEGALALGIVVPVNFAVTIKGYIPGQFGDVNYDVRLTQNQAGLAWGQRIFGTEACESCGLYVGAALLGSYQVRKGALSALDTSVNRVLVVYEEASVMSAFATGGLIWHVSPGLNLGFRLQIPNILVQANGQHVHYALNSDVFGTPSSSLTKTTTDSGGLALERWAAAFGVEWRATRELVMLADYSFGESSAALSGGSTKAPMRVGVAGRYRLGPLTALVAGLRGDLGNLWVNDPNTETRNFGLLATAGLMWRKKDFETALGMFNYRAIVVSAPDSARSNPGNLTEDQILFVGAVISGLYRF